MKSKKNHQPKALAVTRRIGLLLCASMLSAQLGIPAFAEPLEPQEFPPPPHCQF